MDADDYADVYAEMDRLMDRLRAQGRTPYAIPVGGSVPLGSLGYVNCALEIANQAQALGVTFDSIVSAVGSGGTYAGLTLGAKLYLPDTRSVGIGVCDDPFEAIALDLMGGAAALLEADVPIGPEDVHIHYHIGPGYAQPSPEGAAAVRRLAFLCRMGMSQGSVKLRYYRMETPCLPLPLRSSSAYDLPCSYCP